MLLLTFLLVPLFFSWTEPTIPGFEKDSAMELGRDRDSGSESDRDRDDVDDDESDSEEDSEDERDEVGDGDQRISVDRQDDEREREEDRDRNERHAGEWFKRASAYLFASPQLKTVYQLCWFTSVCKVFYVA